MRRSVPLAIAVGVLAIPTAAFADDGAVRVLHASPNAPAVDVYVNGAKTVRNLRAGKITPYLSLAAGTYSYAIRVAGAPKSSVPVRKGSFRVRDGKAITIAATNFLGRLKVRAIKDANAAPFGAAKIRVVHLSPDAPAVDIVAVGLGKVVSRLRYGKQSGYLTVPAGRYTFLVRPAGKKAPNVIAIRNVDLKAGSLYTAWALGSLARPHGLKLRGVLTRDALPATFARTQVRVLHASPGAPNVDVYVNGAKAIENLPYKGYVPGDGTYLKLPSGKVSLAIRPAGAPAESPAVYAGDADLRPQATVTVAATGLLTGTGTSAFALTALGDDVSPIAADKARVTAVHLSPDTPAVDIFAGVDRVVPALAYPSASAPLEVPAGTYTLTAAPSPATAGSIPVVTDAALGGGSITTIYALGLLGGAPALEFLAVPSKTP